MVVDDANQVSNACHFFYSMFPRNEDERDVKNVMISMIFVFADDSRSSSFGLDIFAKHLKTHLFREVRLVLL